MSPVETLTPLSAPGPDAPPIDFTRERAAYARERDRLLRDHLGEIALIHEDEVVGVYGSADDAITDGYRRFGLEPVMLQEICDESSPDFVNLIDTRHPSFQAAYVGELQHVSNN